MGRYRIPADAWRQATLVLLRYPETKKAMDILEGESRTRIGGVRSGAKPSHPDPTATAALRLYEDAKYQRLKREAKAVESAVADLDPVELEVIRLRFWSHRSGVRHVRGYWEMEDTGYSRRQMQRVVRKVVHAVAVNLGEL